MLFSFHWERALHSGYIYTLRIQILSVIFSVICNELEGSLLKMDTFNIDIFIVHFKARWWFFPPCLTGRICCFFYSCGASVRACAQNRAGLAVLSWPSLGSLAPCLHILL
uniref:Uncharacterized protein n=1 Tax=Sander lucioperca TaxID=283035 RepID=A0A8D0CRP0_SANLU